MENTTYSLKIELLLAPNDLYESTVIFNMAPVSVSE